MTLNEIFYYDTTSPSFLRWKIDRFSGRKQSILSARKGECAGSLGSDGYYTVPVNGKQKKVHRVIMQLHGIDCEGFIVDHIDRNKQNNVFTNLRLIDCKGNNRNHSGRKTNTSGANGVYFCKRDNAWVASWSNAHTGKKESKNFSCSVYGDTAFQLAVAFRRERIVEMNTSGAGYPEHLLG